MKEVWLEGERWLYKDKAVEGQGDTLQDWLSNTACGHLILNLSEPKLNQI